MLNKRREAAQEVANRLIATENAIDLALACAAELTGCMPVARTSANLAAEVGQGALEQAAETFATLVRARRQIVETHRELAETKDLIGLRAVGLGGLVPKPNARDVNLVVVARSAA